MSRREVTDFEATFPGNVIETKFGEFYLCERSLSEFHTEPERVTQEYVALFDKDLPAGTHEGFYSLLASNPEKVLFLDIETTGLSNCPLFLVGTMYLEPIRKSQNIASLSLQRDDATGDSDMAGQSSPLQFSDKLLDRNIFKLDLLFARDYSEEAAVLHYLNDVFAEFDALATFNGKSFDIPFIKNRMSFHRMLQLEFDQFHFDVLIHSRRKWRGKTPNCQLQTLETHICGRRRIGDIPSAMIPDVYREFVRTGNTRLLKEVFHHNALDLITIAELIVALLDD